MIVTDSQRSSTWSADGWRRARTGPPGLLGEHVADVVDPRRVQSGERLVQDDQLGPCTSAAASCTRCWLPCERTPPCCRCGRRSRALQPHLGGERALEALIAWSRPRYSSCSPTCIRGTGHALRACSRSGALSLADLGAIHLTVPRRGREAEDGPHRVVLPAPLGREPTTWPAATLKERSSSAVSVP